MLYRYLFNTFHIITGIAIMLSCWIIPTQLYMLIGGEHAIDVAFPIAIIGMFIGMQLGLTYIRKFIK